MKPENIKNEYRIIINDRLSDVEIARLREVEKMYSMRDVSYNGTMIELITDLEESQLFSHIATWLSYIGGETSIFCIQRITTFYTGFTSPEVKDLMRT